MYARNLTAFLLHLVKDGKLRLDLDDEIIRDTLLTRGATSSTPGSGNSSRSLRRSPGSAPGENLQVEEESSSTLMTSLYVFMLAAFIGFEVIRRVSPLLHTPLMSLTNALDAIAVVGAIILAGEHESTLATVLGTIAIVAAMSNVVGGFLITDRMLRMFKASGPKSHEHSMIRSEHVIELAYLVATALFILSLKWMSSPSTARRGVRAGELGMLLAIARDAAAPRDRRLHVDRHRAGARARSSASRWAWCR